MDFVKSKFGFGEGPIVTTAQRDYVPGFYQMGLQEVLEADGVVCAVRRLDSVVEV